MNTDDDFASVILVKRNFVDVLSRELDRPSWTRELVAVGTATDPYQPIEGHYRLTRGARRADPRPHARSGSSRKARWSCGMSTCSRSSRGRRLHVYMSVPTVDEDAWRTLEPGTAHPLQRLRAVRELTTPASTRACSWRPSSRDSLVAAQDRADDQGDRGPRRPLRRLQRDVPAGRHAHAFHAVSEREFPPGRRATTASTRRIYRQGIPAACRHGRCAAERCNAAAGHATESAPQESRAAKTRNSEPLSGETETRAASRTQAPARSGPRNPTGLRRPRSYAAAPRLPRGGSARDFDHDPAVRPPAVEVRAFLPALADRQLDVLVDDTLQEPRAERQAVSLVTIARARRRRSAASCPPWRASARSSRR